MSLYPREECLYLKMIRFFKLTFQEDLLIGCGNRLRQNSRNLRIDAL